MKRSLAVVTYLVALTAPALAVDLRTGWTTPTEKAALMFAAITFTEGRCTGTQSDDAAYLKAIAKLGLRSGDVQAEGDASIKLWLSRFLRYPTESCVDINDRFGPKGDLYPGIVLPR